MALPGSPSGDTTRSSDLLRTSLAQLRFKGCQPYRRLTPRSVHRPSAGTLRKNHFYVGFRSPLTPLYLSLRCRQTPFKINEVAFGFPSPLPAPVHVTPKAALRAKGEGRSATDSYRLWVDTAPPPSAPFRSTEEARVTPPITSRPPIS